MHALRRTLVVAVLAAVPALARAQSDVPVGSVRFFAGADTRSLTFRAGLGLTSATETAVPLGFIWTVSSRLAFDVGASWASVSRTPEGASQSRTAVSGLTDTQVRGVFQVVPDLVVLTVAASLPTGKTQLTVDQQVTAGVAASELIPFPVQSFGSGASVTTGLAVAVPIAGWAVGLGGSYRLAGAYSPLAAVDSTYKPGSELRLRAGADRVVGQGRVSLGFTYSTFADDEFGGLRIFQPGKRYITQGAWSFPIGNVGFALYAWDLYRDPGKLVVGSSSTEKQNVITLGAAASVQLGPELLRPQVEYRVQSAGITQLQAAGRLLSVSVRAQLPLSGRYLLLPAVRYDAGNVAVSGVPVGFTGWGASLGFRATL